MFDYQQRRITKEAGDNYDRIFKQGQYTVKKASQKDVCKKETTKDCDCKK